MKDITRYNPSEEMGLSKEQVLERMADGLVNFDDQPKTKSIKQIIASNFFTYFNFLNICLGVAVFSASLFSGQLFQGIKNCLFMGVIIVNSIISIIEEIISKKIIDQLSILSESKVNVIRDGETQEKAIDEIVLDDVILLKSGHQVVCDAIVLSGEVEVNEAFVTGESDAIVKTTGDMILSGSFIVSGVGYAKVERVGSENYISTISAGAKYNKKRSSVIMNSFEHLLKIISVFIVPIGIVMFAKELTVSNFDITSSVFGTVASLIGMIPEGLILLTSSVMAVSVIRLSRYKVLVQKLKGREVILIPILMFIFSLGGTTYGMLEETVGFYALLLPLW